MSDDARWHWGEGMKYALEGIKTLFFLNGAASVSILTFIGNMNAHSECLVYSMVCFAFGAASTTLTMLFAYLTQLQYGNSYHGRAKWWHYGTYACAILGLFLFLAGVVLAARGLLRLPQICNVCGQI
jgi:uncharacterized protein YqgC (DUF456 family)